MEDPPGKRKILPGQDVEQVVADLLVLGTAAGTSMEDLGRIHHQDRGIFRCQYVDQQGLIFRTGIGFCKQFSGTNLSQQVPVSPQIIVFNDDFPGKDHADRMDHISCIVDVGAFLIRPDHTAQTVHPDFDFSWGDIFK